MSKPALQTQALIKRYGGLLVTDSVSIDVREGELHAIIGPNGAGKTTLINQLSGELWSDAGDVVYAGQKITALPIYDRARRGVLRSYQITSIFEEFTVLENTVLRCHGR
uniref:Putative ABC transporter ATP-binding protein n=1 Tax=Achromobacter xylosoxidans (strain A8) TaxID=762376 RepID=Q5GRC7_ACHXA|nr:putative ABC transporter ATP-binding protein [Achromobacter xylosoxidans A8]